MLCEFKLPIVVMESVVWMWPWGFLRVIIRLSQSYYQTLRMALHVAISFNGGKRFRPIPPQGGSLALFNTQCQQQAVWTVDLSSPRLTMLFECWPSCDSEACQVREGVCGRVCVCFCACQEPKTKTVHLQMYLGFYQKSGCCRLILVHETIVRVCVCVWRECVGCAVHINPQA